MKNLIPILFLLPITAFAQISFDGENCAVDVDGTTVEWACAAVSAPPPDPEPEPDPTAVSEIIAIGDSWIENTSGSCSTGGFDMWPVRLSNELNLPLRNYARCGAPSGEMYQRAQTAIANGIVDSSDLILYWLLPNDFSPSDTPADFPDVSAQIQANASATFAALLAAGADPDRILILTLPPGDLIPLINQGMAYYGQPGTIFSDYINGALRNAAAANGLTVLENDAFFINLDNYGRLTWLPDGKHFTAQSNYWIAEYVEAFIEGTLP